MGADRPKVRAVFDCMIFLQGAARRESAVGACLLVAELAAIELCLSEQIIAEVQDVLTRSELRRRFPSLTGKAFDRFLAELSKQAVIIARVPRVFAYDRDPKDEPYINLAIAAGAHYLVSRDNDLLDPAKPENPQGQNLRHRAPNLRILNPASFLADAWRDFRGPA